VYCTYATPRGHAHVGARLYLPKEWATHTPPPEATTDPGPITVTPDPVTPDPVTPDPVTPDPVTPDPVTPDPVTPDPVSPDPVTDDQCQFKTKPALAVDILTDLHGAHVLPPWVTGDEVYGQSKALASVRDCARKEGPFGQFG
jgi:SRSO17 transposase